MVLNIALLAMFLHPLMCSQGLKAYATVGSWWCLIGFQRMNMTCSKGLKAYATVGSWLGGGAVSGGRRTGAGKG